MKRITTTHGLKIKAGIRAGGLMNMNHNRRGLAVRSAVKAGGLMGANHNRALCG